MKKTLKKHQSGAATLVVAVVLLISITLVTLFTAKVVLEDTKIEANTYRTAQAFSAANYGLDFAINYFDQGGFDQLDETVSPAVAGTDDVVDSIVTSSLTLQQAGGGQITTAQVQFIIDAERCGGTLSWQNGLVLATGFSDDTLATRVMGQCVGPISILNGDGPEIPLISRTRIDTTGNANIINRYTNTNIWSADEVVITGASMGTYIRDPGATLTSEEQFLDVDEDVNTQLVSNRNLGNGADIISGDPSLKLDAGFFGNFFNAAQRSSLKDLAAANQQSFGENEIGEAVGKSGLIYLEGDQSLTGGTIGSIDSPAIVIVDGDLKTTGNPIVYGIVYVVNKFDVGGTPSIVGASIVENEGGVDSATGFEGNGTLNLVYWQNFLNDDGQPLPGLTSVIEGSWRDW
ncbi:MAG: pilus assembly PilX N-terminal domain-containing protein [Methylophaga sp.]